MLLWAASGALLAILVIALVAMRLGKRDNVSLISRAAALERLHGSQ